LVKVTPGKRPEEYGPHKEDVQRLDSVTRELLEQAEKLRSGDQVDRLFRYRILHPGTILPPGHPGGLPVPENLSVMIHKEGNEPAKIVVKRGDDKWEITEKELDKLPKDVRTHVERFFGPAAGGAYTKRIDIVPDLDFKSAEKKLRELLKKHPPEAEKKVQELLKKYPPEAVKERIEDRLEKRIEQMDRRIEKLRQSVEELLKRRTTDELHEHEEGHEHQEHEEGHEHQEHQESPEPHEHTE
jgi:TolA-binding protein